MNEHASALGKLSIKKRFAGKTKEEISEMMSKIKKGKKKLSTVKKNKRLTSQNKRV